MEFEMIRAVLRMGCGALLAGATALAARSFSGARQRRAVGEMRRYFTRELYPRGELAEHLQTMEPPDVPLGRRRRSDAPCPAAWAEGEERERNSPYFLRTGQQVSVLATAGREENWYGLENWVRDLAASRVGLDALVEVKKKRAERGRSDA